MVSREFEFVEYNTARTELFLSATETKRVKKVGCFESHRVALERVLEVEGWLKEKEKATPLRSSYSHFLASRGIPREELRDPTPFGSPILVTATRSTQHVNRRIL